jgi:hypothetical protein
LGKLTWTFDRWLAGRAWGVSGRVRGMMVSTMRRLSSASEHNVRIIIYEVSFSPLDRVGFLASDLGHIISVKYRTPIPAKKANIQMKIQKHL